MVDLATLIGQSHALLLLCSAQYLRGRIRQDKIELKRGLGFAGPVKSDRHGVLAGIDSRLARKAPKFLPTAIFEGRAVVVAIRTRYCVRDNHCDWSADEPTTRNSYFLPFNLNFIRSLSRVN